MADEFPHGTVHETPVEMQAAIRGAGLLPLWEKLPPLGRNEFICWVLDAKQPATREKRVRRTCEELQEGKKRPCCWAGCIHRTDKAPGPWQQAVLVEGRKKRSG